MANALGNGVASTRPLYAYLPRLIESDQHTFPAVAVDRCHQQN